MCIVLGSGDQVVNKTNVIPVPLKLTRDANRQVINWC